MAHHLSQGQGRIVGLADLFEAMGDKWNARNYQHTTGQRAFRMNRQGGYVPHDDCEGYEEWGKIERPCDKPFVDDRKPKPDTGQRAHAVRMQRVNKSLRELRL